MAALVGLNTPIVCVCSACVLTKALLHTLQPEGGLVQTWEGLKKLILLGQNNH